MRKKSENRPTWDFQHDSLSKNMMGLKGEYGQYLAKVISKFDESEFNIPDYIKEALIWIMGLKHWRIVLKKFQ